MPESLDFIGGPWRNRTFNLLIKSQVLCLVELVARHLYQWSEKLGNKFVARCQFFFGITLDTIFFLDRINRIKNV